MQTQKSSTPPRLILTAMMVLILLLVSAGVWFYQSQKQAMRQVMIRDLSAVAQLKVDQLTSWRAERLGNAELIINSPTALPIIASFLAAADDQSREIIRSRFMSFQANHGYQDVVLLDPAGTIRLTMTGRDRVLSDCCVDLFYHALTQRRALFTHVYLDPMTDEPSLAVIAPLYPDTQPETEAMGALLFISNMREQLFPMIQDWPLPSDSAEAYIVVRDGDAVQVLSDVRHRDHVGLDLRIPLQHTNDPAVAAVLGHQGIFEGEDYRGVHVVAAVLPVPDSPWFIVVKKDAVEIFAEWRFRALMISGLLATLVLSIGAVGILLWQRERRQYFERMYAAEALLRASVERHSVILKAIGDAVIATDTSGRVELLNQVAEQLTGWSETEARGRQLDEVFRIISEETLSPVESPVTKVLKEGLIVGLANHTLLIHRDGSERPIADSGAPIFDDQGQITGVVLVFRDQTEERRTVQQLRESATTFKKLSQVVEQNSAAVIITDINANIEYVNSKFTEITGYSAAEVIGKNPRILQSGEMDKSVHRQLWSHLLAGEQWQGEFLNKHRDGHLFWVRAQISPLRDDQGRTTHYIAVKEDITIQKRNEKQLEYQASYDALTGLANRTLLMDRLDQAIRYAQRSQRMVAVLLLDLDRFKVINDTLGHTAGDTVLCQIAERLKSAVRDTDTVARFGGDEFIVLLTEVCSEQDLDPIIQNILQVFKGPCQIEQRQLVLAASIGISIFPQNSSDPEHLIRYADIAMYQSKQSGSEFAFYSDEMDSFGLDTLDLEHDLHGALQRQEFCLHYQPKVDLQTGTISGCEALLRWQHPKLGMVSPGQFIPLAEQTNLIVPIGAWVLEEACRQSLAWQAAGLPPIRIAVNLSARQFRQGDLAATVNSILSESGLDPGLLELELTESMIMDDPQGAEQALVALKNLGVSLSLDDFGTGYSSLNYLSRFPVDHLKIDQSFIRDIGTSAARTAVVSSIIDIAHNLQLMAIAEGVETQDQLAFLVANKCDAMQGYLFSKPLPAGAFAQLLRQGICLNDIVSGPAVDK